MNTIDEALSYITSAAFYGSKPGLDRTEELLSKLGDPQKTLPFIHVAGTNGKGSVCSILESILTEAGYKTGLFTSPHLVRSNERIRVGKEDISDDDLLKLIADNKSAIESVRDTPTEFEIFTCLALKYFAQEECDIVILEVGLGGELDSTNIIPAPEVAVITAIGLDHTAELGGTIAEIASAKAGIIKPGTGSLSQVVFYGDDAQAEAVIRKKCAGIAELYVADRSRLQVAQSDVFGSRVTVEPYGEMTLSLAGSFQPYNMLTAITAIERLTASGRFTVSGDAIVRGVRGAYWPGRFERLSESPLFVLDGAHNPQGAAAVRSSILALGRPAGKTVILIGVLADKDFGEIARLLHDLADVFVCVEPPSERALRAKSLATVFRWLTKQSGRKVDVYARAGIPGGVRLAIEKAGQNGRVFALGSLYMSGDIRKACKAALRVPEKQGA
ncbi:MAG: bifunctional folylpolyglutamate synthase/dihydrofolate synthase [Oscillospiraceae bacterium]|jgi:dihydrofolate synthase/folylpolyglutamate synthase|nr:bifunctional folylpolyglutamate synthase/dihydrofolate synthase [Oscillospiraceae bacterium]